MKRKTMRITNIMRNKKGLEGDELVDVGSIITFFFLVVLFAILFSVTKSCTSTALEEVKTEELLLGLAQQDLDAFLLGSATFNGQSVDVATLIVAAEKDERAESELKAVFASRAMMFNDAGRAYKLKITYPDGDISTVGYETVYSTDRTVAHTFLPTSQGEKILVEFSFTDEDDRRWLLPD